MKANIRINGHPKEQQMVEQVEISSFDLRFQGHRLRHKAGERVLLASIAENGIRDPLQGVDMQEVRILIDGFKRYRCARMLGIGIVPYCSFSSDAAAGIIEFLRVSNKKSLSIVEQARLIEELKRTYQMSTADIAGLLEKSKSWVSVRSGMIGEMSQFVMEKVFCGQFPAYAYLYVLRPFIRINKIKRVDIDEFVGIVAGKTLSIRNIELLAKGYFKGSDELREQLRKGNVGFALSYLQGKSQKGQSLLHIEQAMLKDLELTLSYMQRVASHCVESEYKTGDFFAQVNLLTGGILKQMDMFMGVVRQIHDRSSKA
jgi:hypothetical protein